MTRSISYLICILFDCNLQFFGSGKKKRISPKVMVLDFRELHPHLVALVFAITDWHPYIFKPLDVLLSMVRIVTIC